MPNRFGALRLMVLGWYVAICLLLGIGGGLWLDSILHTAPLFLLLGLFLGLIAAFVGMMRMVLSAAKDDEE